ncbi:glutamyl-tRNA amidotransferase [Pseudomonas coronafaciens pv. porri]|uniref:Glutamyl-tRNA amidotransferase n=1 Tax=Pseudomonas coronafaciens pv. porri TaxID=83964 RepID=A0ABR5JHW7_9PSED|nr:MULTISPECIES: GAD-like domain-containing protein [Pseudomonas syringae group]KEZ27448.1 glutamyl-tRNA amidotransferase [Pseudomonas amygdali pv. tabaci str. 6605]KIY20064.1 glutamyl-tRNA amidotransferase [Pseudomonas amygdali pv. tabaci]KOP52708.1 glutamyl-tRNA amidotransferase [Pseudomonas coronafaciens pv. porri]BCS46663.1 aspartyl-tRNA amidotransferase subunit B [Pseudomonas amygdali pv. tabaci]
MDEVFSIFLQTFGRPVDRQEVPTSSIELYRGKLPNKLLEYWAEHGWCGYGEGIFWIVNPQEYEGVVASWIEGTKFEQRDTYHLIARSAFGDLYLWGEKTGFSLKITSCISRCVIHDFEITSDEMDRELQNFLLSIEVEYNDFDDLFTPAKKKLGTLRHDEMYGFVPALMLGGSASLDHVEKLKTVEHLILLSQLAELEPYSF